jgi:hypothetical protein
MEKQQDHSVTFSFESGTTQDDMIEYVEVLRKKFAGKIPEDELENLISNYVSSIANSVIRCDSCDGDIPKQTNYSCKKCGTKFDLCKYCEEEISKVKCPENFGCNNLQSSTNKIFISNKLLKDEEGQEPLETYNAYGETYLSTPSRKVNIFGKYLLDDFSNSDHYLSSAIYIPQKEISHKLLEDLWLYFRTTDITSLEKYGPPSTPIIELASWKLYQTYAQISECFTKFISVDEKHTFVDSHFDQSNLIGQNEESQKHKKKDVPLMMRIIYPNGDTFGVKRAYGELANKISSPFATFFVKIPTSQSPDIQGKTDYDIEYFRHQLEETTSKTVEQLNEIGQVLLIAFSVGK